MSDPHPLNELETEELVDYIRVLLKGADTRLDTQNFKGAAIRIANALGALSFIERDCPGITSFTTLGFRLKKAE